jgi:mRNA interferase HigB
MQVIVLRTLKQFWRLHRQVEIPLRTWYGLASQVVWSTPQNDFGAAVDFVADNTAARAVPLHLDRTSER